MSKEMLVSWKNRLMGLICFAWLTTIYCIWPILAFSLATEKKLHDCFVQH
jgi:hypothetical protein